MLKSGTIGVCVWLLSTKFSNGTMHSPNSEIITVVSRKQAGVEHRTATGTVTGEYLVSETIKDVKRPTRNSVPKAG